ncbi:MAG TPA: DUF342 domain-containing protein [Thermoanaerobacterales bacterium]|nr:DUF342 domain-containing protein [Thermoanaerobacterales bacterium]
MNKEIRRDYFSLFTDIEDILFSCNEETGSYACIKDGSLEVYHPEEGPYPMVIPCPGAKLIVNGCEYTKPIPVSMQDNVSIHTTDEVRKGNWSLTISKDGLEAILQIKPTVIIHRKLLDMPPGRYLKLEVVEWEEYKIPLTWDDLLQELSIKGIKHGIDWVKCSHAVTTCDAVEIVIARGDPPKPGKDGYVEFLFTLDSKIPVLAEEDETVDFRKRYTFTSVEAGDVLAIKHSPEPGGSGTSVTGEIILPPTPREVVLSAGEGAILTKDGKRVVATRSGRPTMSRRRNKFKVSVVNELVHAGDVDLSSGNIGFKGDVLILGNVTENMLVESKQDIKINGLVSCAKVQASGSILVQGNILSSLITAGRALDFQKELLPKLHTLADGLREMVIVIQRLQNQSDIRKKTTRVGIGPIVKFLLEEKYDYLIDTAKLLCKETETAFQKMSAEEIQFVNKIKKLLIECSLTINDLSEIENLAQQASTWEQAIEYHPGTLGNVIASSIQNSSVIATGDIQVVGSGCYISHIQAKNKVSVSGVVRGGIIRADGDVFIGELGSKGGAVATVIASPTSVVTIGHAFINSVVKLGGQSYRFDREEKNIRFQIDKEGNLRFIYL